MCLLEIEPESSKRTISDPHCWVYSSGVMSNFVFLINNVPFSFFKLSQINKTTFLHESNNSYNLTYCHAECFYVGYSKGNKLEKSKIIFSQI